MNADYQHKDRLTARELAEVLRVAKTSVLRRAEKERWPYDQEKNRVRRYNLEGVPEDVRRALIEHRYPSEATAKELAKGYRINVPAERLEDPGMAAKVRMVVECMAVPEGSPGRRERIREIAERYESSLSAAYRLMERAKKGKPLRVKSKAHGERFDDLGVTLRAWDRRAGEMAIAMIMENRRRHVDGLTLFRQVQDTAEAESAKNPADKPLKVGSYSSFMNIKKRIDNSPAGTRRDKGRQGLRQDVIPPIRRDPTAYRPMEVLVGDQHKADYYAFDSSGRVVTLELFFWMDFRTQLVWPSIAYKHYNRYTVGQALINAVRWGLPSTVYTDWGKPEKSNYLTLLVKQLIGLGIKTDSIEHVLATGRHPQAKPIEGFFGNFDGRLKNARIPGYCKRLKDSRENELQQNQLNQLIKANQLLPTSELTSRVLAEVQGWNEHHFKNRAQDNGKSPLQVYQEEAKQYPVTGLSEDVLDYIFLPLRQLKIKNTTVRFKHEWLGTKVFYDRALADYNGSQAEVRYDPFDPWRVWVFVDGELICEAGEWEMINPKINDQVAEKMAEQMTLMRQISETYKKYLPPKAPVRRINPAEREARQIKAVSSKDYAVGSERKGVLRVLETSLERDCRSCPPQADEICDFRLKEKTDARHADGGQALAAFRKQFHPGARKADEPQIYKPPFKLSMKQLRGD